MKYIKKIFTPELIFIISIFLISRIFTWYLGYVSYKLIEPINKENYLWTYVPDKKIDIWGVWDSGYYIDIAKNGYSAKLGSEKYTLGQANYAFFPAYPFLLRQGWLILKNEILAGIIISNIALFIACISLYFLLRETHNKKAANNSVLFLLAFPTAFIFTSVYSESLFLAFSITSVLFAKRNNFLLAGIFGMFSALTRNVGIILFIPLFMMAWEYENTLWKKLTNILFTFMIPAGTFFYILYVKSITNSYFSIFKIQESWGRKLDSPIKYLSDGFINHSYENSFSSIFFIICFLFLIYLFFAKYLKLDLFIYSMLLLFIPVCTGITSIPRYILGIFPLFIGLGILQEKHPNIGNAILFLCALTQGMMLVFWTSGFHLLM